MLNRAEILEKLKGILVQMDPSTQNKMDSVSEDSKLLTDLGMGSVSMLYMVIAVEETFGIVFDSDELFTSVGQVIDFIQGKLQ